MIAMVITFLHVSSVSGHPPYFSMVSARGKPKSGNKFPNTKFAVKARIIKWVIIIQRLDGVLKFLFKPFLSFDNNLI